MCSFKRFAVYGTELQGNKLTIENKITRDQEDKQYLLNSKGGGAVITDVNYVYTCEPNKAINSVQNKSGYNKKNYLPNQGILINIR